MLSKSTEVNSKFSSISNINTRSSTMWKNPELRFFWNIQSDWSINHSWVFSIVAPTMLCKYTISISLSRETEYAATIQNTTIQCYYMWMRWSIVCCPTSSSAPFHCFLPPLSLCTGLPKTRWSFSQLVENLCSWIKSTWCWKRWFLFSYIMHFVRI